MQFFSMETSDKWISPRFSIEAIFHDIVSIMKKEMAIAGTVKIENNFNDEEGHILLRATNIAGFGQTHVIFFLYFFMFSCVCIAHCVACFFSESRTKTWSDIHWHVQVLL